MDKGAEPAAWAIVLLVPPPHQGLPGQCNRHMCEREGQSLLFDQRPPPTHWSRRAPCQMRLSDFSPVQAAQVWTGRAVSAIRSKTTAHSLAEKSSLPDAACLCRQTAVTGVAPAAWAIVLLVPPPPQGSATCVNGTGSLCYSIADILEGSIVSKSAGSSPSNSWLQQ